MPGYQDGQPDGPEPDNWRKEPPLDVGPKPHGYFEPNKNTLLDHDERRTRRAWLRLLNDETSSNDVWWARLMCVLRGLDG